MHSMAYNGTPQHCLNRRLPCTHAHLRSRQLSTCSACPHACTRIRMHACVHACMHACRAVYIQSHAYACAHASVFLVGRPSARLHACTPARPPTCTHAGKHTCTRACAQACTRTRARFAHACMHTGGCLARPPTQQNAHTVACTHIHLYVMPHHLTTTSLPWHHTVHTHAHTKGHCMHAFTQPTHSQHLHTTPCNTGTQRHTVLRNTNPHHFIPCHTITLYCAHHMLAVDVCMHACMCVCMHAHTHA